MSTWQSQPIQIANRSDVNVDVRASAEAVVLAQGNGVWFHDLHMADDEHVIALINSLQEGLVQKRAMQAAQS